MKSLIAFVALALSLNVSASVFKCSTSVSIGSNDSIIKEGRSGEIDPQDFSSPVIMENFFQDYSLMANTDGKIAAIGLYKDGDPILTVKPVYVGDQRIATIGYNIDNDSMKYLEIECEVE